MISKSHVLSTLKNSYPTLKQKYHLLSMELFGSVARGDQNANDVDIAISYDNQFTVFTLVRLADELEQLLGAKIDIVCKETLTSEFAKTIADDLIAV